MEHSIAYCDYNAVIVVNKFGKLKKVNTPFHVRAKKGTGRDGELFIVEEVHTTKKDELVFLINNRFYYHSHFTMDIVF